MQYRLWKVSPILLCNKLSPSKLFNMNRMPMDWEIIRFLPPPPHHPPHPQIRPSSSLTSKHENYGTLTIEIKNKMIIFFIQNLYLTTTLGYIKILYSLERK